MKYTVLDYLEKTAEIYPDKVVLMILLLGNLLLMNQNLFLVQLQNIFQKEQLFLSCVKNQLLQ